MNTLTKEVVEQINSEYCVAFYKGDSMEQVPFEQADTITFFYPINDFSNYIGKSFKLPKKKVVDFAYFAEKLDSDNTYITFVKEFNKFINQEGLICYPTTYGFGVFVAVGFRKSIEAIKTKIEDVLNSKGIIYKTEYSDAGWVFRYKISKSKENISKLTV